MTTRLAIGILILTSALLTSCAGPGFESAYQKSLDSYQAADPKPEVSGPWEGYWLSDKNGHTGKLRAIGTEDSSLGRNEQGSGKEFQQVEFRYHATWAKILSGGYTSDHLVRRKSDGSITVRGEKEIAFLGLYTSEGTIEGEKFESRYHSDADQGVFVLRRPSQDTLSR